MQGTLQNIDANCAEQQNQRRSRMSKCLIFSNTKSVYWKILHATSSSFTHDVNVFLFSSNVTMFFYKGVLNEAR